MTTFELTQYTIDFINNEKLKDAPKIIEIHGEQLWLTCEYDKCQEKIAPINQLAIPLKIYKKEDGI